MSLFRLIRGRLVRAPLAAKDKRQAIEELVEFLVRERVVPRASQAAVLRSVHGREDFLSTGMEHGVALPHGVSAAVPEEVAAVGIAPEGIPFDSFDRTPARVVILLLTPAHKAAARVKTLAEIARTVNDPRVRDALTRARTVEEVLRVLEGAG